MKSLFKYALITLLIVFTSCKKESFKQCEELQLIPFEHPLVNFPLAFPNDWDVDVNVLSHDTIAVAAIDTANLGNPDYKVISFISFPLKAPFRAMQDSIFSSFEGGGNYRIKESGSIKIGDASHRFQIFYDRSQNLSFMIVLIECEGRLCAFDASVTGSHDNPDNFCFIFSTLNNALNGDGT